MSKKPSVRQRIASVLARPWAIEPGAFVEFLTRVAALHASDPKGFFLMLDEPPPPSELAVDNGVATIRVRGVLAREESFITRMFGDSTYDVLREQLDEATARRDVKAIVLDVDSPGGDALGLSELADAIFAARATKKIDAVVRGFGASAAYFIASAASSVFVAREAMTGSIGVIQTLVDWTKFDQQMGIEEINIVSTQSPKKHPDPKTDAGRAQIQAQLDAVATVFVGAVARNRGVKPEVVLDRFGQGDVLVGEAAVAAGLADGVATIDSVIAARQTGRAVAFLRPLPAAK